MVAPIIIGGMMLASIVGPPIIDWVGKQTWNKTSAENEKKIADAAAFDQKQREQGNLNPYIAPVQQQTSDPMSAMMPMMMMMMMIPMMQGMMKSKPAKDEYD